MNDGGTVATRRGVLLGAAATAASGVATPPRSSPALVAAGVSLALARRRATQIGRVRYDLALDVTAADLAAGTIGIAFDRRARSGDLVLDFRGPLLSDILVNGRPLPDRRVRRIFFLPAWIDAFIGGQTGAEALSIVDAFLAEHPDLPVDVRRKILLSRDELELTVRIRRATA